MLIVCPLLTFLALFSDYVIATKLNAIVKRDFKKSGLKKKKDACSDLSKKDSHCSEKEPFEIDVDLMLGGCVKVKLEKEDDDKKIKKGIEVLLEKSAVEAVKAVLSALKIDEGFISDNEGQNFVFFLRKDGSVEKYKVPVPE